MAAEITDTQRVDWVESHRNNAPHTGRDGKTWYITAHGNRECWGHGQTWRDCVDQAITGTGPEMPDTEDR